MIYRRPDSKFWWMNYTDAYGIPVRRSTQTEEKKDARVLYQQVVAEVWREKHMGVQAPRTLAQVLRPYLHHARRHQRSVESTLYRVQTLKHYFPDDTVVNRLTGQDIRSYSEKRLEAGAAPATINRELSALSAAINYCNVELDWQVPNPITGRRLREPDGRVRWLTRAQVEGLCRKAAERKTGQLLEDFIRLAVHTGGRKSELLGLEVQRIDLQNNLIILEHTDNKSDKRRSIPLNHAAQAAILRRLAYRAQHCPDSPWLFCKRDGDPVKSIRTAFEKAVDEAGIQDFTIHDLRHTCAAWLVTAGVPLIEVRDLLGHASIEQTEIYAHLAPFRVRQAVSQLDLLLPDDGALWPPKVISLDEARDKKPHA